MNTTLKTWDKWNPFREMEELHNQLSTVLGRTPRRSPKNGEESLTVAEWAPMVDITEDDNEYLIQADLPQLNKDDVKVRVENDILYISGERKFEKEDNGKKYHRVERSYGSFVRSFAIPEDADPEKVEAEFKDGVLKVHLKKSETAKPKSIDVKVS